MKILTINKTIIFVFIFFFVLAGFSCKKNETKPIIKNIDLTIAKISPTKGNTGTLVIITGTGFSTVLNDNKVTFNGVSAVVEAATETSLSVRVPKDAGTGKISIKVGTENITGPDFEYINDDPTITSISLNKGPGLSQVTITGTGFSTNPEGNIVTFNGIEAIVGFATSISLLVEVPLNSGSGKVEVKVGDKKATGPNFEYEYTYMVSTLAGKAFTISVNNRYGLDGKGTEALFNAPTGLILDAVGNIYVGDSGNNCIRRITSDGVVNTFAGINSTTGLFKEGAKSDAGFSAPQYILEKDGVFYISDTGNKRIRKINTNGIVSTLAGNFNQGDEDGTGGNARFSNTGSMVMDSHGDLFVVDIGNFLIRKVTSDGVVTTFAGKGFLSGSGYADGKGKLAQFGVLSLAGMAIDSHDNIYVSDPDNNCIRKITPDGTVSTYAGVKSPTGTGSYVDGLLGSARFTAPAGLAIDKDNNIYVLDSNRIRKISAFGIVSTVAGSGISGVQDGLAMQAQFKFPSGGLTISQDGKFIYVAEYTGQCIRKIGLQ